MIADTFSLKPHSGALSSQKHPHTHTQLVHRKLKQRKNAAHLERCTCWEWGCYRL